MSLRMFVRPISLAALTGALLGFAPPSETRAKPAPGTRVTMPMRGPFRIPAIPMAQAFVLFRDVCMTPLLDRRAFDAAVEASGLGFRLDASTGPDLRRWGDGQRSFSLETYSRIEDGRRMQACSFRVAIGEQVTQAALIHAIGEALASGRSPRPAFGAANWKLGGRLSGRLEYLPVSEDPRFFELLLRRTETAQ